MKKITFLKRILIALFFLPIIASAQIFNSGFENSLFTDWENTSSGTGMTTFEINGISKRTDANGFHMAFSQITQKGNLFTPKNINWKNGETYRISFYYKAITPSDNNTTNIKVHASNGAKLAQFNLSLTSTEWVEYTTDYVADVDDTGGYVLFSIRPSNAGGGEFYFDDFLIEKVVFAPDFFGDLKSKDVASDETIKWTQFGPGMSGNNTSFYVHPTDPNTIYSSPNMGNSYRSTDKGLTFETILNEDAASYKSGERGPIETYSVDFARTDENFGFCTGKLKGDLFKSTDKGKLWTRVSSIQAQAGNSYLACAAVDPKNDGIWYVGAGRMRDYGRINFSQALPNGDHIDAGSQGKIWKSTNQGDTWTLINSGLNPNAEVETIYVDPVDSNLVYASTNYGFYKSMNGGATWVLKSDGIDNDVIRSFAMYHNSSLTGNQVVLYVISNVMWKANVASITDDTGGIFKSTDNGETWNKVNGNLALNMSYFSGNTGIEKSFYNTVAYYFGLSYNDAVSTYPNLPTSITQRFNLIEVDPNDANNIYLINNYSNASENNFKPGQIWRSTNSGASWFVTLRNGTKWNNGDDDAFWNGRGNPLNTNITMKYKSDWLNRDDYERKGSNFIKFNADGSVLFTQMAKIGFVSYDKGVTWVDIDDESTGSANSWVGAGNSNVPGHGFYQSELIPNKIFCSSGENSLWITNDEGSVVRSGAQGASVMDITGGEHSVSSIAVHPSDPNIWFATFFRQEKRGELLKSTDSGVTWNSIGTPVPLPWPESSGGDQSVHQLGLLIDKNNPNNMYFCVPRSTLDLEWVGDSVTGWGVHKSTDGGATWSIINSGLPSSLDVARIAFDPNSTTTLYAAVIDNGGGLFKSIDSGATWTEVASTTAISGSSGINDIHFDANGKAYITSGYKNVSANDGGLWVSDDAMATWTKIFDYPWTNRVEVAKYDSKTIMVSTLPNTQINLRNAGTFLSKDSGQTWVKFNKGNGQADRVNDIAIDYTVPGKYYASTRGSGWYTATDPNPNSLGLEDKFADITIYVYPNPTNGELHVKGLSGNVELKVYSIEGKLVLNYKSNGNQPFNVTSLSKGIYVYSIKNNHNIKTGKFIKK